MKRKKLLHTFLVALIALMSACSSDELVEQEITSKQIIMNASDFTLDKQSRTAFEITPERVKFTWAVNDTVGIFPNEGTQVAFPMAEGAGSNSASFNGGGWALKPTSSYAAYFPYNILNRCNDEVALDYENQVQEGNGSTVHLGKFDYMIAKAVTPEKGNVTFNFDHLGCMVELNITLPNLGNSLAVVLSTNGDNPRFMTQTKLNLISDFLSIYNTTYSREFSLKAKGLIPSTKQENVKVYCMMFPVDLTNEKVSVRIISNGVAYEGVVEMGNLTAGKAYTFNVQLVGQNPLQSSYHVQTAGTLPQLIDTNEKYFLPRLKLSGNLNGTDIRFIREMAGRGIGGVKTEGQLVDLDLTEATIVDGGFPFILRDEDFEGFRSPNRMTGSGLWQGEDAYTRSNSAEELFKGLTELENLKFPKNLKTLGRWCCYGCHNLKSITFPPNISAENYFFLGENFNACLSLEEIIVEDANSHLKTHDGALYDKSTNTLLLVPSGKRAYTIPPFIETVHDYAFPEGGKWEEITLNAQNIDFHLNNNESFLYLKNFKINGENPYYSLIDGILYSKDGTEIIKYPANRLPESFIVSNKIKVIGHSCFAEAQYLKEITIPEGVEIIGGLAFFDCRKFRSITLPSTIKEIQGSAFQHINFSEVVLKSNIPPTIPDRNIFFSDIDFPIFVPDKSLELYKRADHWNYYADRIFPISSKK